MADNIAQMDSGVTPEAIETAADFASELRQLRERAGLTIREVARASGSSVSTTGDYFSGRHLPLDREQFARILEACGETDPARVERWQAALARVRRSPGRRGEPPYRGLARFEVEDARLFFGREYVTERLAVLAASPSELPLLLVGASGAGKSSLLRAGLLARLREDAGSGPDSADGAQICDLTASGVSDLAELVAKMATAPGPGRGALIVDQFETIFTLCPDEAERRSLITALCDLARTSLVVLALRADYYDQVLPYPGLVRALQERHVLLGAMTAQEVRRAVVEPARLARTDVAGGLVEVVLADLAPRGTDGAAEQAAYDPGALPLLSHAMLTAWDNSKGGVLTVADYLAGGGIKEALTQSAERAYASLTAEQQLLARRLFLRLVHVADDLPPSRAAVPLGDLVEGLDQPTLATGVAESAGASGNADAERVLEVFIDERMITVDTGAAQLTHDALLTAWPRLRTWIEESAEDLRAQRRIAQGARVWAETGREEAALWRGSQLAAAVPWSTDPDKRAALLPEARAFVDASVAAGTARERLDRRRTRRLRTIIAFLSVLVLAVGALTGYAFEQRQVAASAEAAAIASRNAANSREVAFLADQLRAQDPAAAAQLSAVSYEYARTPEATASVLESSGAPSVARIEDSASAVQWAAVSPDKRLLVAAGADGTLRLWNVAVPGRPVLVSTLTQANKMEPLYTAAFSPDGKVIAAAGAGQVVKLWAVSGSDSASTGLHVVPMAAPLTGPGNTIYSVAFSHDGQLLAAGSADGTVRLWDVADMSHPSPVGKPLKVTGAGTPNGYVESVAFSPDDRTLAAGTAGKTVWLWNVVRPAKPVSFKSMPLTGPGAQVSGVAFSPDGRTLAATSQDNKVWLWSVQPGGAGKKSTSKKNSKKAGPGPGQAKPAGTLTGATNWTNTLAFSPGGSSLAVGTSDASVLIYDLATRTVSATLPQPQPVTSVSWDGPGTIAATNADGDIALWALPSPVLAAAAGADAVAYSPDGTTIAVGGSSVQLWNAGTHALLAAHSLSSGVIVNALAFSRNGAVVAVALSNGTGALVNGRTLRPLGKPFAISATNTAESLAFSPDGSELVTGGDDGTVRLFDVTDPAHPRQLTSVHDSGDSVYTVAFAPDGATVAAASVDDDVRLWHVSTGAGGTAGMLTRIGPVLSGMASYAIGLAFSPDSHLLAVGSADKTVLLWDVANPARPVELGAPLTGPSGYVWAAAFSPDGKTLAVGVTDHTVWLWNVAQPAHPVLIATLTGPADHVYAVAFSPSGSQLAATSYDGSVWLWDTSTAAARNAICANLGQPLTRAEWSSYVPGVPYRASCPRA